MPNIIENSLVAYRNFQKIYRENAFEVLELKSNKIKEVLGQVLRTYSVDYKLKKKDSLNDSKLYHIKSRIKEPESFFEKLIRKDIGLKLMEKLDFNPGSEEALEGKRAQIINEISGLDDIIGLRIVTELKNDCKNVLELLRNNTNVFSQSQITFIDLHEKQPQKMRNGLDIYRIKGVYEDMYGFELQIKSKIDEAWGDLDHTLFYKDYSVSPIKDTVQLTMNNVGDLLDKIENLLFDLRESGGNYSKRESHLQEQKELEDELGHILLAKFGVTYNLKEITSFLSYFRDKLIVGEKKLENIEFDFLSYELHSDLAKSYSLIRSKSHALMILESIYLSWKALKNENINQENINSVTNIYINELGEYIDRELSGIFLDGFSNYLENLIVYDCSPRIFLNLNDHLTVKAIFNRIDEVGVDMPEGGLTNDKLKQLLSVNFFDGNSDRLIEDLLEEADIIDVLVEIKNAFNPPKYEIDYQVDHLLTSLLKRIELLTR